MLSSLGTSHQTDVILSATSDFRIIKLKINVGNEIQNCCEFAIHCLSLSLTNKMVFKIWYSNKLRGKMLLKMCLNLGFTLKLL